MTMHVGEVFVTKYALTTGVTKIAGEEVSSIVGKSKKCFRGPKWYGGLIFEGDYAITEAEAVVQITKKIAKKEKAIAKSLLKLQALNPADMVKNAK